MIEFVPLQYYFPFYLNACFVLVLLTLFHTYVLPIEDKRNINYIQVAGYVLLAAIVLYVGLRPVSGRYFTDMRTYEGHFNRYAAGGGIFTTKDVFFHLFMKAMAQLVSVNNFFLICAILYILPMYRVCKVFFKQYWFYAFLILIVSFQFWPYGVNGIRNGIATSFFLLGVSFYPKKIWMAVFFILASQFHGSVLLCVVAFVATFLYNNPKGYLIGWLMAIPFSLVLGGVMTTVFTSLGFAEDRLSDYLSEDSASGGFRFDFLLYSASAVFTGWYFIFKRGFRDTLYNHLFNTYLITNAFWILIIRANFSNRFAYLSWFMIGLIIIYPFLKQQFFNNQNLAVGRVIFLYFGFTYFMYAIYYG